MLRLLHAPINQSAFRREGAYIRTACRADSALPAGGGSLFQLPGKEFLSYLLPMSKKSIGSFLKPFWQRFFPHSWQFGLLLVLIWTAVRFVLVLQANRTGSYQWVSLIFVSMWITPWIFLTREGRRQMGWRSPRRPVLLLLAVLGGAAACGVMYVVAQYVFGNSVGNWFHYIGRSYPAAGLTAENRFTYFVLFALIGMTFSPVGEELFYRGLIHEAFALQWGDYRASVADSTAFALAHLAHFGIVYTAQGWRFLIGPALLWMSLLYFTCRFFFFARQQSGSVLGAVVAHAGFNVMMMYLIFYWVLE